jgi:predicted small lipoprotein YifL
MGPRTLKQLRLAAGMLFGPPMLGLLADFTKVRWAFVADAAVLAVTAMLFAALAGEPGRGLYLPPADAAAAAAAGSRRCTVPASAQLHEQRVAQAPMMPSMPGDAAATGQHGLTRVAVEPWGH